MLLYTKYTEFTRKYNVAWELSIRGMEIVILFYSMFVIELWNIASQQAKLVYAFYTIVLCETLNTLQLCDAAVCCNSRLIVCGSWHCSFCSGGGYGGRWPASGEK